MSVIRTGGLIALRQSFTSIGAAREGDGPLVEAWLNERLDGIPINPIRL
jgi:hypothetical protein